MRKQATDKGSNKLFPKQSPREVSKSKREQRVTSSITCQVSRPWGDPQHEKKCGLHLN